MAAKPNSTRREFLATAAALSAVVALPVIGRAAEPFDAAQYVADMAGANMIVRAHLEDGKLWGIYEEHLDPPGDDAAFERMLNARRKYIDGGDAAWRAVGAYCIATGRIF